MVFYEEEEQQQRVKNVVTISPTVNDKRQRYMADFLLKSNGGDYCRRQKCCCGDHECNNGRLNFGPLYTITGDGGGIVNKINSIGGVGGDSIDERTYDEPYAGDLPRRSWLCCPGTQHHIDNEQPPLLDQPKSPPPPVASTPGIDVIVKAPTTYTICSIGCVRISFLFLHSSFFKYTVNVLV